MQNTYAVWYEGNSEVAFGYDPFGFREMRIQGGLQWNERDEYKYHQVLFGTPVLMFPKNQSLRVLVLGGGDGLGVRELLLFQNIEDITLVDISPMITAFSSSNPFMTSLNFGSLNNPKVKVINKDGFQFVREKVKENVKYDVIVLDYPDPSINPSDPVNRLFSFEHFYDVSLLLKENGIVSIQSTSVGITPNVFRKLQLLVERAGFKNILPLRVNIKSYGDIGVIIASKCNRLEFQREIPEEYFYDSETFKVFLPKFLKDERPNIPDSVLIEEPIHRIIYYDFKMKWQEDKLKRILKYEKIKVGGEK